MEKNTLNAKTILYKFKREENLRLMFFIFMIDIFWYITISTALPDNVDSNIKMCLIAGP